MARDETSAASMRYTVDLIRAWNDGAAPYEDALECLQASRSSHPECSKDLDELILRQSDQWRRGLLEAQSQMEEVQKLLDQFGEAPLMPAMYLYPEATRHGGMAVVACGSGRRVVALASEVDPSDLRCGDPVYLSSDQSVLVASAASRPQSGEMAEFVRYTADGRVVVKSRGDESIVLEAASTLEDTALRPGDTVRWDRPARIAQEKMDDAERNPYLLEQVADIPLESIGGQKLNLNRIKNALLNSLIYPDRARRYRLPCSNTLLLYGPPGNGKTCMTRAVFSEIQRVSGKKVFLAVVKAAGWESMWVGQTQSNITALFTSMRQAAQDGSIAVLFIDELEAVGRARGGVSGHHSDKALSTLLNEMNGFQELQNVSVVGACNRKDLLDAALLSRFGDEIQVRRPDLQGAREIFAIHLEDDLPYEDRCERLAETRMEMIERAVSRLYAPNADSELCVLKLRDGKTRPVTIRELVSGRLIQHISHSAKRRAFQREIETSEPGLRVEDMDEALSEASARLMATLTPHNVHNHLDTLAEDVVVVAVEQIHRRVARPFHYIYDKYAAA